MRHFHLAPAPLLQLIASLLLAPTLASPTDPELVQGGISFNQLFERGSCDGTLCGWNQQLCCSAGSACYTDANQQAQCSSTAGTVQQTTAAGGYWQYFTSTYTETDLVTRTSVYSSYIGGYAGTASAADANPTASCDYSRNESPCGDICCASDQYCYTSGQCKAAANGGSSGYYSSYYSTMYETTNSAGVPLRPTSSTLVIVTETNTPTTTVPFETPVATGANMTFTSAEEDNGGGGLSGGAIAGIVIGVLAGLLLLGLLCFYCCVRGLFAAICGGRRKRRTTEIDEYERYSHHGSGAGAGRTWYGARKPARAERRNGRDEHEGRNRLLGLGAGLAGLWALLGLKRRHDRRHDEKYSEYSYGSDYYTSASSASSDDRRTRDTRRSMSRR